MVFTNWGPYFWGVLHIATYTAPSVLTDAHREGFRQLVSSYQSILPCPVCQQHFSEVLAKYPLDERMTSSTELFLWSVDVHNEVNLKLGKPAMSYAEAVAFWGPKCKYLPTETKDRFPIEIAVVIGLIVTAAIIMKFKF